MTYENLKAKTEKYGEKDDCAVKAIAVVLGTTYEDAHTLLKAHGRKDGCGTKFFETAVPALESRGFKLVNRHGINRYKTVKNLERYDIRSKIPNPLLILTSGHILALKDNKVEDFTSGGMHRIKSVWEVVPTEDAVYSVDVENFVRPNAKPRRVLEYRYALVHKETKQVYERYKKFPTKKAKYIDVLYLPSDKANTLGKLELIEI